MHYSAEQSCFKAMHLPKVTINTREETAGKAHLGNRPWNSDLTRGFNRVAPDVVQITAAVHMETEAYAFLSVCSNMTSSGISSVPGRFRI